MVIDVFGPRPPETPAPGPAPAARRGAGAAATPPRGAPRLSAELRPVRTVVVDAGHGGSDPGATGIGGVQEKRVTLRIARALRPKLEAEGLRVVLTREGDRSLTLEERTAIAEGVGGDLFLSIHANAAPRPQLEGIETYYLDKSHERHALRVAALENGVPAAELDPLQRTLASFRVSQSSEQSALLAAAVHGELVRGVRGRFGGAHDLGVKTGPFYVLFLSSMPSILIEAGFLTHKEEARRLASEAYVELVADRIARGVAQYRERRGTLVAGRLP